MITEKTQLVILSLQLLFRMIGHNGAPKGSYDLILPRCQIRALFSASKMGTKPAWTLPMWTQWAQWLLYLVIIYGALNWAQGCLLPLWGPSSPKGKGSEGQRDVGSVGSSHCSPRPMAYSGRTGRNFPPPVQILYRSYPNHFAVFRAVGGHRFRGISKICENALSLTGSLNKKSLPISSLLSVKS